MFKVECPGCKAPYQVDERRVPASGLKMRCPKCGTSFQVEAPDDGRRTGPTPVLGAPVAPAAGPPPNLPVRSPAARTIVGVAPSALGIAEPPPAQPRPPAAGAPPRPAPPAPKAGLPPVLG
ncbi:MAG TPA: zinc-ribbon domain-containing protein, partial [Polyangiaceae bacterium]